VSSGGKVRPEYLNVFDINQDVYFAQIDLDKLISILGKESLFYKELNKFPSVRRDLSLLINEDIQFKTIADICLKVDRKTLKYVNLFDVYEGKGVESGKKSYAVNFTFENSNKTLTDKEVDKLMKKIISSLEKEIGAKLR
jgi:phenylalanyl-tRNA synthetase beta chain